MKLKLATKAFNESNLSHLRRINHKLIRIKFFLIFFMLDGLGKHLYLRAFHHKGQLMILLAQIRDGEYYVT